MLRDVVSYFRGDTMRYEYNLSPPDFTVENISILSNPRPLGHKYNCRNGRPKYGFLYTACGTLEYAFLDSGNSLSVKAGGLIFIPRNCRYICTYAEENTEVKSVQFDLASGQLPPFLSHPTLIELPNVGEQIDAFFKPMKNHAAPHPFYYLSCFYSLLWNIVENRSDIPAKYKKLQASISHMNEHYRESFPVSYYASLCGMSEVNFRRLFREYVGHSPIDYRNNVRLTNARIKLQSGEYNVSEAAETCGFSNLSFFIRSYKKKYGYTPKKE